MADRRIPVNEGLAKDRVQGAVFFSSAHLLCLADRGANIVTVNQAWEDKLGWTEDDLWHNKILLDIPLIVHPDDMQASLRAIEELGKQNEPVRFHAAIFGKNGVSHNFSWRVQQRGKYIYTAAIEITVDGSWAVNQWYPKTAVRRQARFSRK